MPGAPSGCEPPAPRLFLLEAKPRPLGGAGGGWRRLEGPRWWPDPHRLRGGLSGCLLSPSGGRAEGSLQGLRPNQKTRPVGRGGGAGRGRVSQEAWHPACGLSCSCTNTRGDPGSPIPGDPSLLSASFARAARPAGLQTLHAPASTQLPEPGTLFLHLFCTVPPAQLPETSVGGNPSLLHFPHALLCYGELLSGPRAPWNTWGWLCQRGTDAISHLCYLGHSLPNNTCKMSSNVCWDHSHASGQLQEVWGAGGVFSPRDSKWPGLIGHPWGHIFQPFWGLFRAPDAL